MKERVLANRAVEAQLARRIGRLCIFSNADDLCRQLVMGSHAPAASGVHLTKTFNRCGTMPLLLCVEPVSRGPGTAGTRVGDIGAGSSRAVSSPVSGAERSFQNARQPLILQRADQ